MNVNIEIVAVWRHGGEVDRLHYTIRQVSGRLRRLYADAGTPLYTVLKAHLDRASTDAVERLLDRAAERRLAAKSRT